jgi:hypothetical protein
MEQSEAKQVSAGERVEQFNLMRLVQFEAEEENCA